MFQIRLPDDWATVITFEAAPGYRVADLPAWLRWPDGCTLNRERDFVVPVLITQSNPTDFTDSPQYILQVSDEREDSLELSTETQCFDLVNAAMSSTEHLARQGSRDRGCNCSCFESSSHRPSRRGDTETWSRRNLEFHAGPDWVEEHGGDPDDPVSHLRLLDTTLPPAGGRSANDVPLSALFADLND